MNPRKAYQVDFCIYGNRFPRRESMQVNSLLNCFLCEQSVYRQEVIFLPDKRYAREFSLCSSSSVCTSLFGIEKLRN